MGGSWPEFPAMWIGFNADSQRSSNAKTTAFNFCLKVR